MINIRSEEWLWLSVVDEWTTFQSYHEARLGRICWQATEWRNKQDIKVMNCNNEKDGGDGE